MNPNKILGLIAIAVFVPLILFLGWSLVRADDTGAVSPGTLADNNAVGTATWSDPSNAASSNNSYASLAIDGTTSHYLKATNFDFSAVPDGATIDGILVEIERHMSGADITDSAVRIVKADGTVGTTNKASGTGWVTTLNTYYSYGGASDVWGETWTASDIKDADFGVVLSVVSVIDFSNAFVDHIRITVYYTTAAAESETSKGVVIQNASIVVNNGSQRIYPQ